MQNRADKSCGKNVEQEVEPHASTPPTTPTVYQLDDEPRPQLATEASIQIGPYALTFALTRRIAQDLRNSKSALAIAELKSRSGNSILDLIWHFTIHRRGSEMLLTNQYIDESVICTSALLILHISDTKTFP